MRKWFAWIMLLVLMLPGSALADDGDGQSSGWGIADITACVSGTEREVIDAEALRNGRYLTETIALITYQGVVGEPETELGYGQIFGDFPIGNRVILIRRAVETTVTAEYFDATDGIIYRNLPRELFTEPYETEEQENGTLIRKEFTAYDFEYVLVRGDKVLGEPMRDVSVLDGQNHALAESMDGKWGVIDGAGVFLLPPVYDYINSYGELMCFRGDSVDVFRKSTLEFIGNYPYDPVVEYFSTVTPEVFVIATAEHRMFYSSVTGEELFRVPVREDEFYPGEFDGDPDVYEPKIRISYNASWQDCFVVGCPDRLIWKDNTENFREEYAVYSLTTLRGEKVADGLQLLELLIWNQDKGYYLFGTFDPEDYEMPGWAPVTRPEIYGDDFRCGIMDQDGNIVLEAEYTDITVLSPRELLLWQGETSEIWTIPE